MTQYFEIRKGTCYPIDKDDREFHQYKKFKLDFITVLHMEYDVEYLVDNVGNFCVIELDIHDNINVSEFISKLKNLINASYCIRQIHINQNTYINKEN